MVGGNSWKTNFLVIDSLCSHNTFKKIQIASRTYEEIEFLKLLGSVTMSWHCCYSSYEYDMNSTWICVALCFLDFKFHHLGYLNIWLFRENSYGKLMAQFQILNSMVGIAFNVCLVCACESMFIWFVSHKYMCQKFNWESI